MSAESNYEVDGTSKVNVNVGDVPIAADPVLMTELTIDVGYPMSLRVIGDDKEVRVHHGSYNSETYTPDEAMAFGVALIRAAFSQGAR